MASPSKDFRRGFLFLILAIAGYFGVRYALSWIPADETPVLSAEETAAVEEFKKERQQDSIRHQTKVDSLRQVWAREKAERQQLRMARERAYTDSLRRWGQEKAERAAARAKRQQHYDSLHATYMTKLPKGSTVDPNTADTTLLQRIPGIGRHFAFKIVAYREALGGFVSADQVAEVEGLPHDISIWFRLVAHPEDPQGAGIRKLNLNSADFKTLVHHPYLSYEQTKCIVNLRQKTGRIRSWNDLRGSSLFTEDDIRRLKPYCHF